MLLNVSGKLIFGALECVLWFGQYLRSRVPCGVATIFNSALLAACSSSRFLLTSKTIQHIIYLTIALYRNSLPVWPHLWKLSAGGINRPQTTRHLQVTKPRVLSSLAPIKRVAGYPDDKESTGNGVTEMQAVVKALGNHGMYGRWNSVHLLRYWPSHAYKWLCLFLSSYLSNTAHAKNWKVSVPIERLQDAVDLLCAQNDVLELLGPSTKTHIDGVIHLYSHFKFKGVALFFVLTTAQACHLPCELQSFG